MHVTCVIEHNIMCQHQSCMTSPKRKMELCSPEATMTAFHTRKARLAFVQGWCLTKDMIAENIELLETSCVINCSCVAKFSRLGHSTSLCGNMTQSAALIITSDRSSCWIAAAASSGLLNSTIPQPCNKSQHDIRY